MSDNTFTMFGTSFQHKLIANLLVDITFLQQIQDILQKSYFDSDAQKWIVGNIKEYFDKYKTPPTLEALKILTDDISSGVLKMSVVDNLKSAYQNMESTDLVFVQERSLEFCKNQAVKEAITKSVDLLESGNYDGIRKLVDDAMRAGSDRNVGHIYKESLSERINDMARDTISTPWDSINEILDGGLGHGELGFLVGAPGGGKSWALVALAVSALKQGLNVVHYTLELNERYTGLRYDSVISGYPASNIKYHGMDIQKRIDEIPGDLLIKYYPTKSATVQTISSHLQKIKTLGKKVDMVVVDYADIMSGVGKEKRFVLGAIYEDLRGMAGEFEIPIWTASQANRCHILTDEVETENGKIEIGKVKEGDEVLTHDGYKKITRVFPVEKQPVYKVKLKSGKEITVSDNHDLPVMYGKLKSVSTGLKVGDKLFTKKK